MAEERREGCVEFHNELTVMKEQVNRLHYILYENGFAGNVKKIAGVLEVLDDRVKTVEKNLNDYILTRELTCPVVKDKARVKRERWTVAGLAFTGIATSLTFLTLLFRLTGIF